MVTEGKIKRGKVVVRVRGKRTKAEMRVHLGMEEGDEKKMTGNLSHSLSTCACMWTCLPLSAACVLPLYALDGVCMYACVCWQAGVTSGFHEGLSRQRAAKYSTEGIRGNLLIREKRVNLRSCNCKWRWGLSEGLSVSLQGEHKQARSGSLAHMHGCVRHSHKHTLRHANTSTHESTHTHTGTHNAIQYYSIRLFLLALINCIIWTANPPCQRNNNTADKWISSFNRSHDFTALLRGLTTGLLPQICSSETSITIISMSGIIFDMPLL